MKERNNAIDILKGIGILLVLVAHSMGGWISQFSYTFHMPLFFIVTGLFISEMKVGEGSFGSTLWKGVRKDAVRLLGPAMFTMVVIMVVEMLWYVWPESYLQNPVDVIWDKENGSVNILGNLWFLIALFFGKMFFYVVRHYTKDEWLGVVTLIIGGALVLAGQWVSIPFYIQRGAGVLPFIWMGYYLKHHGGVDKGVPRWCNVSIVVWLVSIYFGVKAMDFPWLYVGTLVAASGGTLAFYYVSKAIDQHTRYARLVLAFLGVYSLILICAPSIETYCFPMQDIIPTDIPMRKLLVIGGKVGWCAVSVWACLKVPFLKRIFGIK